MEVVAAPIVKPPGLLWPGGRQSYAERGIPVFSVLIGYFADDDLFHNVAGPDLVNHFEAFINLTEAGMVAVQMGGILTGMADEKLGSARITAGVCHRKYAAVVELVVAGQFTFNLIARTAAACSVGASALNDEVGDYAVEGQAIVKIVFRQIDEVGYSVGGIFFEEHDLHNAFGGVDFGDAHDFFCAKVGKKHD